MNLITMSGVLDSARRLWRRVIRYWLAHYDEYVAICLRTVDLCDEPAVTLRRLDMALWAAGGSGEAP